MGRARFGESGRRSGKLAECGSNSGSAEWVGENKVGLLG
jgi:hypothetical protein